MSKKRDVSITSLSHILEILAGFDAAIKHLRAAHDLETDRMDQVMMAQALATVRADRRQYLALNNVHLMDLQAVPGSFGGITIHKTTDPQDNEPLFYVAYPGGWVAGTYYSIGLANSVMLELSKIDRDYVQVVGSD